MIERNDSKRRRAIVIGGGIAGPVAAMALQRAGMGVELFEAHPRTDGEVGSYFTIAPNGLDALASVDALHLARAVGFPTRRNLLVDADGRRLGAAGLGAALPDGTGALTMKRHRLSRALLAETERRRIPVRYGARIMHAEVLADGRVHATFSDGGEAEGDVLVGADGIHSVTRRLIDPNAPEPRYVGLTNFGGVTRGAAAEVGAEPEAWTMIFGRRGFFGYTPAPNGDLVWFVNWPRDPISAEERAGTSNHEWRRRLRDLFIGDAGPAVALIEAGELELAGDSTYDLPHVPHWHRGPMVIIGDAAHAPSPTSGQGASMSAEDGALLAKALRDVGSVPEALAAFERLRRPRVEKIVAWGARGSSAKIPSGIGRVLRDAMMRLAFRFFLTDSAMAWQFGHRVEWDRRFEPAT